VYVYTNDTISFSTRLGAFYTKQTPGKRRGGGRLHHAASEGTNVAHRRQQLSASSNNTGGGSSDAGGAGVNDVLVLVVVRSHFLRANVFVGVGRRRDLCPMPAGTSG